jgi:hypothetical protein
VVSLDPHHPGLPAEESTGDTPSPVQPAAGPLFKELYTGLVDVEDPTAVAPMLAADQRALLDHTTDIQNFAQFQSIHRLPEKWGTRYHHHAYVSTMDALQK